MPRYHLVTLGCKLNRFDSAVVEGILASHGLRETGDPAAADVIVLNTCTVTSRADQDARKVARRLRRANPRARLVATGCYAERDPGALDRLGVFDDVVGLHERARLPQALLGRPAPPLPGAVTGDADCGLPPVSLRFGERGRAFLKIQEGCDLVCSYCVIPSVRGPSRSVPERFVEASVRRLAADGVREICLTGVNTGAWGRDLRPRRRLADLLERLVRLDLPVRFRLNSLEPLTVDERILALIADHPRALVPHVQIPLQSGSDRILAAMRRNYRAARYAAVVERAAAAYEGICLGADVITGFPGETDADHRATMSLIASLPLAYLHVFSYSPRPGTPAADRGAPVPSAVIRERNAELRSLSDRLGRRFRSAMIGRRLDALALGARSADGWRRTLTGNYLEVLVPDAEPAERFDVIPDTLDPDGLRLRGAAA